MKKVLAVIISVFLFMNMSLAVSAESVDNDEANYLKTNGILLGNDGDLMLDRYFTVEELMTILSRLTGEEDIAKNFSKHTSFKDVPANKWSEPFIAWAENKGLLAGVGNGKSGYLDRVTAQRLIAFLLRILNYSGIDYKEVYNFGKSLGLMDNINVSPNTELNRGQMCKIVYRALDTNIKNSIKLGEKLGLNNKPATGTQLEASEISSMVSPAVFYIEVKNSSNVVYASGSGFIIDKSGIIATNYHVIEGAYGATIKLVDGRTFPVEKVLAYDKNRDIAVLKIAASNLPQVKLGDSDEIKNGDKILTIGSPEGLENTISDGLVSNRKRLINNMNFIQISAPISHGSSGGALLNYKAEVIGITTAYYEGGQNLNLAIPINDLKPYLNTNLNITLSELAKLSNKVSAPSNVRARVINNAIEVGWDKVEGADNYYLYYSYSLNGPYYYAIDENNKKMPFYWSGEYSAYHACDYDSNIVYIKISASKGGVESDLSAPACVIIPAVKYFPKLSDVPQPVVLDYSYVTYSADERIVHYFYDRMDVKSYIKYLASKGFSYYYDEEDDLVNMTKGSTLIIISVIGNNIVVSGLIH